MTDIEQEARAEAGKRMALIKAAVKVIEPNVVNETAAWNTWNNLASSETFVDAILAVAGASRPASLEAALGGEKGDE